ncbi:MAG: murein biosynthesis integral membrane protein MurJ [Acidobacteriota bacterium]|jgi:putative peptidoglycan lipid II flippase|nr:murein biosynthesis integral membrane protein MurJ [Acidobacteriota bacterium]
MSSRISHGDSITAENGKSGKNAVLVGAGIFSSRVLGIVRERVFAYYFGGSDAADAFKAALKIPNLLQNLFGEGALSASFIPVYAGLLGAKNKEEADRTARAVGSILAVAMALLVLAGILATPLLIGLIAPGFTGEKREATIGMVRILFPGVGILVLSAWCLGVLNSHRKFFLPYAAPVLWNLSIIGALAGFGGRLQSYPLAEIAAWGAVTGSLMQFGVQLPFVLRLIGRFRFQLTTASEHIRAVIKNFIPGVATRGVNQISGYIDTIIASFLPMGSVAAMSYAQTIYLLPVSLFGMSIANAELPEMASRTGTLKTIAGPLRERLEKAMRRVAFFVVPSVAAFLALGDSIVNLLYQTGKFTRADGLYVWMALAGSTVGLLAATLGRLYMSAFWALRDTRTPFRFAALRVALTAGLGWLLAFPVPAWLGLPARAGLIGLTVSAGIAAWIEFALLRAALNRRIGRTGLPLAVLARLWGAALCAAGAAFALKQWTQAMPPLAAGSIVLALFGAVYFTAAVVLKLPEAAHIIGAVRTRIRFRASGKNPK